MQEITSAGGKAKAVELDVSASQDEIAKGIKEAWEAFGHLDILVSADFTVKSTLSHSHVSAITFRI